MACAALFLSCNTELPTPPLLSFPTSPTPTMSFASNSTSGKSKPRRLHAPDCGWWHNMTSDSDLLLEYPERSGGFSPEDLKGLRSSHSRPCKGASYSCLLPHTQASVGPLPKSLGSIYEGSDSKSSKSSKPSALQTPFFRFRDNKVVSGNHSSFPCKTDSFCCRQNLCLQKTFVMVLR